jgi:hypothetical protein
VATIVARFRDGLAAPAAAVRFRLARRGWESGLAFAGYAVLSFLYFGLRLLVHDGRTYPGMRGHPDPQVFIWSFSWWRHSLVNGESPMHSDAIWAPTGMELSWPPLTHGLALAFTPLTALVGPVAAFDVAAVLMPALAAWTAFLLCRHVTRALWPSLAGGYLFGFSAYMLGQLVGGHLHMTSVFLLPLMALVVLRYVEGDLTGRGLPLRLGPLLALQFSFSTEIAFTLTLVLLSALGLAFVVAPSVRARLRSLPLALAGAYGLAGVLLSPLLWFMLANFRDEPYNPVSPGEYSSDLLNFVVPTELVAVGAGWADTIARHFTGHIEEQGAYLGVPALVVVGWFAVLAWRTEAARFLVVTVLGVAFISFGASLHVQGRQVVGLPWEHVGYLTLFNSMLPVRLCVYVALGVSVIVAMWAASRDVPRWVRVVLPALAVLALLPDLGVDRWSSTPGGPAFITDGTYRSCLRPGENTLILPFGGRGNSMLWQAETDFRFRMASGYVSAVPPEEFRHPAAVEAIATYGELPAGDVAALREYLRLKQVSVILVEQGPVSDWVAGVLHYRPNHWPGLLRGIAEPESIGGVLVYRLDGSPACSERSSTTRQRKASSGAAGASAVSSRRSGR